MFILEILFCSEILVRRPHLNFPCGCSGGHVFQAGGGPEAGHGPRGRVDPGQGLAGGGIQGQQASGRPNGVHV